MSETIGFFTAWGNEDFAPLAVANHLKICDKVFVSVEAHHKMLLPFKDKTYSRLRDLFRWDKRVIFFPQYGLAKRTDGAKNGLNNGKCLILQEFLKRCRPDDILMICDSDEFYDDTSIKEIKDWFERDDWDMLAVEDMFFCINMDWYIKASHRRFIRNKPGSQFTPTQHFHPTPYRIHTACERNPMFHYSMLNGVEYKRRFWQAEDKPIRREWLDKIYRKWVAGDDKTTLELAEENYKLTGNRGFWFTAGGVEEYKESPYLFRYHGKHPDEIEKSKLRKVKDFRRNII